MRVLDYSTSDFFIARYLNSSASAYVSVKYIFVFVRVKLFSLWYVYANRVRFSVICMCKCIAVLPVRVIDATKAAGNTRFIFLFFDSRIRYVFRLNITIVLNVILV